MLVFMFIFSIFIYKLRDMILRSQSQIKKNSLVNISNSYTPPLDVSAKNVSFAFKMADFFGNTITQDPRHGLFSLRQFDIRMITNETDGSTYRTFNTYQIPFSKCQLGKNFFYDNAAELDLYEIDQYMCSDWNNLTIQGNWYAPFYKGFTLLWTRCSGLNCSSEADFSKWFAPILMQEIFTVAFFDIVDYTTPVHSFLDNIWTPLSYGRAVVYQTFLK